MNDSFDQFLHEKGRPNFSWMGPSKHHDSIKPLQFFLIFTELSIQLSRINRYMRNILENGHDIVEQRVNFFFVNSHSFYLFPFLNLRAQPRITVNGHHGKICQSRLKLNFKTKFTEVFIISSFDIPFSIQTLAFDGLPYW